MSFEDLYGRLHVEPTASKRDIRKAYHRLALEEHPDKSAKKNAHQIFAAIVRAYEILSSEEQRAAYDADYELHTKRKRKVAQLSRERQQMRRDLEERERQPKFAAHRENMSERVQQELARFRNKIKEEKRTQMASQVPGVACFVIDAPQERMQRLTHTLSKQTTFSYRAIPERSCILIHGPRLTTIQIAASLRIEPRVIHPIEQHVFVDMPLQAMEEDFYARCDESV